MVGALSRRSGRRTCSANAPTMLRLDDVHRIERKILERAQPREARKVWASKFSCNLSLRPGAAHPQSHADWDAFVSTNLPLALASWSRACLMEGSDCAAAALWDSKRF